MSELEELVQIFRREATERIDDLVRILDSEKACTADTLRAAKASAHNLKGAALTVGAQIIAGPCEVFEEEFEAALTSKLQPGKIQLETWVQILAELRDIIGNPKLLPLHFDTLAQLADRSEQQSTEYIRVPNPSGSPAEIIATNTRVLNVEVKASHLEAIQTCLDRVNQAELELRDRAATLKSLTSGESLEIKPSEHEAIPFGSELDRLLETSDTLGQALTELRALINRACGSTSLE